jgi:hypothetical protein
LPLWKAIRDQAVEGQFLRDTRVPARSHDVNIRLTSRKGNVHTVPVGKIARILVLLLREIPFSTGTLRAIQAGLTVPGGKFYRSYQEKMAYP